jgi:glutamine synthetase
MGDIMRESATNDTNKPLFQQMTRRNAFLSENPDIESVDFLIPDINGVMRGKWGPAEALAKVGYPGINMPLVDLRSRHLGPGG